MHGGLIADLAVVMVVGAVTGMLARRVGQPSILGYLLAGLVVGPYIPIPLFADPHRIEDLAEVGVVLVLFAVGLEFRVERLLKILPTSGLTAAVQIATLGWAGFTVGTVLGWSVPASVCLGATLAISSTMVVSAVLGSRPVDPDVRAHVFGVLVVQDVVAIVLMAVVTALAAGETMGLREVGILVGQLVALVATMLAVGLLVLPRLVRHALGRPDTELVVVLVTAAAFGLALAAEAFGFSAALGAFISGMIVAESGRGHEVTQAIAPLRDLFSAIFFVSIGMAVDPVVAWHSLPLALLLCAVVISLQFVSVAALTVLSGASLRRGVYAGLALGQIGELSFILASIAIAGGVVPESTLPALVTVATVTAFTTPLLLGRAQRLVAFLDRWVPDRVHQVLAAYHAFLRRMGSDGDGSLRRGAAAVVLDWAAILVVIVVRGTLLPRLDAGWHAAATVAAVVIVAPFVIGLVRSGWRLAGQVRAIARPRSGPTALSRAVEALVLLAVVLGVGVPTLLVLTPLIAGPWVEVALSGLVLAVLVVVGLRIGQVRGTNTSGVAWIAEGLAERAGGDDAHPQVPGPVAALDYQAFRVDAGSPADGATLAALDLRCRTGATVVAISRGAETLMPTGREPLRAGDVLAVSGTAAALGRAREVLYAPS